MGDADGPTEERVAIMGDAAGIPGERRTTDNDDDDVNLTSRPIWLATPTISCPNLRCSSRASRCWSRTS